MTNSVAVKEPTMQKLLTETMTFTQRTHFCGDITPEMTGETVTINGWVSANRDLGGLVFVEVRDRSGILQIVSDPSKNPEVHGVLSSLKNEDVVAVTGPITRRPSETVNPKLSTGEIEVYPTEVQVLNRSKTPPFPLDEEYVGQTDEFVRLKYRYLDLRRPSMFRKLKLRYDVTKTIRQYMDSMGFLDVETPILIKTTPEGARDYLVPSRVHPGKCFALPQSPQIFKQLLMVAGI